MTVGSGVKLLLAQCMQLLLGRTWPKKILGRGTDKLQAASLTGDPGPYRIRLERKHMTTIIYKDKKYKLPFVINSHSTAMVERTNPFSGQSIELPCFAACVYDYTIHKNLEMENLDKATNQDPGFSDNQDGWQVVRNGIDFFRKYFAREYMVLLD